MWSGGSGAIYLFLCPDLGYVFTFFGEAVDFLVSKGFEALAFLGDVLTAAFLFTVTALTGLGLTCTLVVSALPRTLIP